MLKKIEGFIQPAKLDELKDALIEAGVEGMTVSDVRGFGRQLGHTEENDDSRPVRFLPKTKIEIVVEEERVEELISLIMRMARTGKIGAGKLFVLPVEDAVRVSTSEAGKSAIS